MVIEQLETGRLVAREKLSVEEWWPAAWSKVQEKHCGKILEKPNSFIHINGFPLLFSVDRDVPDVPSAKAWICWSNLCQNIYNISPNLPSLIAWRKWLIFFCVHIKSAFSARSVSCVSTFIEQNIKVRLGSTFYFLICCTWDDNTWFSFSFLSDSKITNFKCSWIPNTSRSFSPFTFLWPPISPCHVFPIPLQSSPLWYKAETS